MLRIRHAILLPAVAVRYRGTPGAGMIHEKAGNYPITPFARLFVTGAAGRQPPGRRRAREVPTAGAPEVPTAGAASPRTPRHLSQPRGLLDRRELPARGGVDHVMAIARGTNSAPDGRPSPPAAGRSVTSTDSLTTMP